MNVKKRSVVFAVVLLLALLAGLGSMGMGEASATEEVYLGGFPIGIAVQCDGLMVEQLMVVNPTLPDACSPAERAGICIGDVLVAINDAPIQCPDDFLHAIGAEEVRLTYLRKGEKGICTVQPVLDVALQQYKIGLRVRDEIAGVGTLTFVREDGRFAGLGHAIYLTDPWEASIFQKGALFRCNIDAVVKSSKARPGELRGSFRRSDAAIGTIVRNEFRGIYGQYSDKSVENLPKIEAGGRQAAHPGKAKVYTCLQGNTPQFYEIEIVKCARQTEPKEKSMVIHVTDPELLARAGGIVQGMSGSPIVQDGKLIGALTHVFINDPTRGYGIYLDWMLQA